MPGSVDSSINVGNKAFLARWFGDETVQGINVVTGGAVRILRSSL